MSLSKLIRITLICLIALCASTYAETPAPIHPIDAWLAAHVNDDISTAGMRHNILMAQQKWEAEMNLVYQRLIHQLTPPQQASLRKAQQQWLKFRDAEGAAIQEIVSSQLGTIHQLSGTNRGMQLVRQRALDLISYEQELEN
jgi:uncharacterized protein YecT (DUF1311 family)